MSKLNKKTKTLIENKSTSIIQNNSEKIKDFFLNETLLTGVETIKLTKIKVDIILTFVMECWKHEEGIFLYPWIVLESQHEGTNQEISKVFVKDIMILETTMENMMTKALGIKKKYYCFQF